jgi:glycosyltransferase involved in cell wall biosynthesis
MAKGNGAYVVHKMIEEHLDGYKVCGYNPRWEYFPPALPFLFRNSKPSLVHTTPDYAIFSRQKRVPLVLSFQNYVLDNWLRQYNSLIQNIHYASDLHLWTRLAVKNAQAITAVSIFTANLARNDLNIYQPIRIIYNGIDTDRFAPSKPKITGQVVRVFFSGNLTRRKGAHWLPEIAERLTNNVTIYYTHGLRTRNSIEKINKLKSVGKIPYQKMPALYRTMDILLHPSVREGFCLSILEAMACGLPIVASDCSSLPEQIDHEKGGFLCSVGDVDQFAERINQLADSPALRKEMGEYNRAKVEKYFTLERMVSEYRELFEQVLESSHRI